MTDESLFKQGQFQYQGKFYPLDPEICHFNVEIHTTFGLRKTLVVTAEADADSAREDILGLSGFVAFDLPVPFNWTELEGQSLSRELGVDDDVSICTEWHQFAVWQSLEILQFVDKKYLMKLGWRLESNNTATAFGWFSFSRVLVHVDDKLYGERRRQLIVEYGKETNIPADLLATLDRNILQNGWEVLCKLAPSARTQFAEPSLLPGNICQFYPE